MHKFKENITVDKVAFVLLAALVLLPGFMIFEYIYAHLRYDFDLYKNFAIANYYNMSFSAIGIAMIVVLMIAGLKKAKTLDSMKMSEVLAAIGKYLKANLHILFLLLFFLWVLISTLCSSDIHQSWYGNTYRNEGFITYMFYATIVGCVGLVGSKERKITLLKMFAYTANVVALIMMLQEWDVTLITDSLNMMRASVFIHFNHMGYYLNMACTLSVGLYLYSKKTWEKVLFLLCYIWQFYVLIVNNTMGGILATLLASIAIYVFYLVRRSGKWTWILPSIVATVGLILMSGFGLIPSSAGENMFQNFLQLFFDVNTLASSKNVDELDQIGTKRGILWRTFLGLIPEHPFVGIGPDSYHKYYPEVLEFDRPANEYISHAVFLGIPGLCFYLASLISLFCKRIKELKKLPAAIVIAAGSLIAYLISAFFGNTMYYTVCYLYMLFGLIAFL